MQSHPSILAKMLASELCGYASVSCVVRLVEAFGATNAELVKTVRKGCIVAFSFLVIEGKPLGAAHYRGACTFLAGALLSVYAKHRKRRERVLEVAAPRAPSASADDREGLLARGSP